jgi:hypothetical protein
MPVGEARQDNLPGRLAADPGFTRFCRAAQAPFSPLCQARP